MNRSIAAMWLAATCAIMMGVAVQASAGSGDSKKATPRRASEKVTLTGCLHSAGARFMLSDVKGDKAPKRRSWRTGYLKKTTGNVELSASSGIKLKDHVGRHVSVVGMTDGSAKHVKASAIRRVSGACS